MVAHRTSIMACLCMSSAGMIGCAETPAEHLDIQDANDASSAPSADAAIVSVPDVIRPQAAADGGVSSSPVSTASSSNTVNDAGVAPPMTSHETSAVSASAAFVNSAPAAPALALADAQVSPALAAPLAAVADAGAPSSSSPPASTSDAGAPAPVQTPDCEVPADAQLEDITHPTTVVGSGTPDSCTSSAFVDAVAQGGVITFDCGAAPVTIALDQTAKVFNDKSDKVVIDGGGKVTLSGGGNVRILYQNTCDQDQVWTTPHCDDQEFPQLTVQNLTFAGGNAKSTGQGGGAIYAQGGRLKVINSQFFNNACPDTGPDVAGGAIYALQQYDALPVYIVRSTFGGDASRANTGSNGGAVGGLGTSFQFLNSTLSYNKALGNGANPARAGTPGGGSGGAIYTNGLTYTLRLCGSKLASNTANEGGGGIFFVSNDSTGQLLIESSTIDHNPSAGFETYPGIFVQGAGTPNFTSSLVD